MTRAVTNFIDRDQLKSDMRYSMADLSSAMMQQASLFVHYGVLLAQASRQVDDLELTLEASESQVYRKLRDSAVKAGEKTSVAGLEKEVTVHPKVIELRLALNEAKQIEAIAKAAVEGFRQRRDMLIQHGATEREEMKGELSMKVKLAADDDAKNLSARVASRYAAGAHSG